MRCPFSFKSVKYLFYFFGQFCTGFEFNDFLCRNGNRLFSSGIDTGSCTFLANRKSSESY